MGGGDVDDVESGAEPGLALGGDDDRRRLVGPEDGHFLADVVGGGSFEAGGADEDERFTREVDVLLVLGRVGGDGLVAELGQLDAQLASSDQVGTVAHAGPVATRRRVREGHPFDVGPAGQALGHGLGEIVQCLQQRLAVGRLGPVGNRVIGDGDRQQEAGGDLGVEGLGRGDAHLDVAPVRGVHHAMGAVGEVAAAPVDDGQHRCAPLFGDVDRAVGVGGGARLRDRDQQRIAHVPAQAESRQFGRRNRLHTEVSVQFVVEGVGHGLPGDGGGALADHIDGRDRAVAQLVGDLGRDDRLVDGHFEPAVNGVQLAAQRLAERPRRFGDLLEQVVRMVATIDVSGRYLGPGQVGVGHR